MKGKNRYSFHEYIWYFLVVAQLMIVAIGVYLISYFGVRGLSFAYSNLIYTDLFMTVLATIMLFCNIRNVLMDDSQKWFNSLIVINSIYILSDAVSWLCNNKSEFVFLNLITNTIFYLGAIVQLWAFWHFLTLWLKNIPTTDEQLSLIVDLVTVVGTLLIFSNIFGKHYFSVSSQGVYSRNPDSYFLSLTFPAILVLFCSIYIILNAKSFLELLVLVSFPIMPYLGSIISMNNDSPTQLTVFSFCSLFFMYGTIYMRKDEENMKQRAEIADKNNELTNARVNVMISQIQPHFLYNVLGSIEQLCRSDSELAALEINRFAKYLRVNLDSLKKTDPILFKDELNHLHSYVELEKMRFRDDLNYIEEIEIDDFLIPPLTIQPLIENSIKHGLMGREGVCNIKLSVKEIDDSICIIVMDDGVGFDMNKPLSSERTHIGIENVKMRLSTMVDGEMKVESAIGEGTVVTIKIPKTKSN